MDLPFRGEVGELFTCQNTHTQRHTTKAVFSRPTNYCKDCECHECAPLASRALSSHDDLSLSLSLPYVWDIFLPFNAISVLDLETIFL